MCTTAGKRWAAGRPQVRLGKLGLGVRGCGSRPKAACPSTEGRSGFSLIRLLSLLSSPAARTASPGSDCVVDRRSQTSHLSPTFSVVPVGLFCVSFWRTASRPRCAGGSVLHRKRSGRGEVVALVVSVPAESLGLIVWTFVSSYCWPQLSAVCRTRPQVPKYTRVLWVQRSWDTGLGWKELCIGQGGTWLFQGPLFRVRIEPQARVCTFVDSHCFCFFVLLLRKWENSCLCHSND